MNNLFSRFLEASPMLVLDIIQKNLAMKVNTTWSAKGGRGNEVTCNNGY